MDGAEFCRLANQGGARHGCGALGLGRVYAGTFLRHGATVFFVMADVLPEVEASCRCLPT